MSQSNMTSYFIPFQFHFHYIYEPRPRLPLALGAHFIIHQSFLSMVIPVPLPLHLRTSASSAPRARRTLHHTPIFPFHGHYSSIHSMTNLGLFRLALGAREPEPLGDARLPQRDVVCMHAMNATSLDARTLMEWNGMGDDGRASDAMWRRGWRARGRHRRALLRRRGGARGIIVASRDNTPPIEPIPPSHTASFHSIRFPFQFPFHYEPRPLLPPRAQRAHNPSFHCSLAFPFIP